MDNEVTELKEELQLLRNIIVTYKSLINSPWGDQYWVIDEPGQQPIISKTKEWMDKCYPGRQSFCVSGLKPCTKT